MPVPRIDDRLRPVQSGQNARVKELRRAFAQAMPNAEGEVAAEGMHIVEEAIRSGLKHHHGLLQRIGERTRPQTVAAVVGDKPRRCCCRMRYLPALFPAKLRRVWRRWSGSSPLGWTECLAAAPALLVIVAGLQDPGNLGTVARSAEAFGASGLLLGERTVSPWNWKAVRASAGSLFRLPVLKIELAQALREMKSRKRASVGDILTQGHSDR